jgi:hypothetical protein
MIEKKYENFKDDNPEEILEIKISCLSLVTTLILTFFDINTNIDLEYFNVHFYIFVFFIFFLNHFS